MPAARIALFLLFVHGAAAAQDPVKVGARLTESRIGVGETTTLQLSIETTGATVDEIGVPALPAGLQLISSSDYTQAQLRMPGGTSLIRRRELVILASAPGVHRIGSAIVRINGTTYRTNPLDLVVTGTARPPSRDGFSSLKVTLHPDTVYVGEQVLLLAEVTFAEEARARQSRPPTFDPPAPSGFWIQDVPDPISVRLRVSEGRSVETQTFRRVYFPLTAGEFRFPPARLQYDVRRGFLFPPESRELASDSARLFVQPLPEAGKPATFNGAVGRLQLSARFEHSRVRVGDPAVLAVDVRGIANVKALPEPQLPQIPDAEVFAPTQQSTIEIIDDRVGGVKNFRWLVVPRRSGTIVLPPVEYAVFDPELRTYVVLRTDTLRLEADAVVANAATDTSLRPLRTHLRNPPLTWVSTRAFAAAQTVPVLAMLGLMAWRRRRARGVQPPQHIRHARSRIAALDPADPGFLGNLQRILCDAVLAVTAVAHNDPVRALQEAGAASAARTLDELLAELRRLRYAPSQPFDAPALRARADHFLADLAIGSRGTARTALLIAGATLIAIGSVDAQDAMFTRATQAYDAGQYRQAAELFHTYALAHPDQADAWYDLGLAAYRADDPGRAVWAWLRAARLTPRDADVRHNLDVAGARSALNHVRPLDRASTTERWLAAAAGWWLLVLGVTLTRLGQARRGRIGALAGAALMALCALTALAAATRPPIIVPLGSGAGLYASPSTRDDMVGTLDVGSVATIVTAGTEWLRVRTADGTEGWVERAVVATP